MSTECSIRPNSIPAKMKPLSRKLKATIGYWIDYFYCKCDDRVTFTVFGEKVVIKDRDDCYYTIFYKWLQFDVYYTEIFEILDFLESLMKKVHGDVEES